MEITEFLKLLSSSEPAPGGGGASALTAALSSALCSMAANLTSGKKKYADYQKDIEQIKLIHNLVKVRGFKLAAAKKIINSNRDGANKKAEVLTRLMSVRDDLQALKRQLDGLQ